MKRKIKLLMRKKIKKQKREDDDLKELNCAKRKVKMLDNNEFFAKRKLKMLDNEFFAKREVKMLDNNESFLDKLFKLNSSKLRMNVKESTVSSFNLRFLDLVQT